MHVLPGPERFDANEWFIIITMIAGIACIWILPRRFPKSIVWLSLISPFLLAKLFDTVLVFPPFEHYYVNDVKEVEWFDFWLYFVYAPFGYMFLYVYDLLRPKPLGTIVYIALGSLLAVLFELWTVHLGVFHYTGWKFYYSLPVYILSQSVFILLFEYLKQVYTHTKHRT